MLTRFKPKIIIAYVQSIYEIGNFIKKKKLKIPIISSIIVSAGVLSNSVKKFLENVFKCEIFNRYGSREVGLIAYSCKQSNKLHINMLQQYIEILDNNQLQLEDHKMGNIIITNLINYRMPLIRYKIGDLGSLDQSQCSCGRGLIRLNKIYGREVDIFKNRNGELIDGEYFTHIFYFRENIKKFQIIQENLERININIVTLDSKRLNRDIESDIKEKIQVVMGKDCKVNFNYVSSIRTFKNRKI